MGKIIPLGELITDVIPKRTADSVLTCLQTELRKLKEPEEITSDWFKEVYHVLIFSKRVEIGFEHAKTYSLALIKENWDNIPLEIRKQFGFSFIAFARAATGKEPSTIDNDVRTARVWLIEEANPGKPVTIKERDLEGRPIRNEFGAEITKDVEFNPYRVSLGKLLRLNSRAKNGKMTPKLWEMLVDDFYTCDDISLENLKGKDEIIVPTSPSFYLLGPGLYAKVNGTDVCIAEEMNWAGYESDPHTKRAIDAVLRVLDVVMEEEKIARIEHTEMM